MVAVYLAEHVMDAISRTGSSRFGPA
jgi:hypothetical protein